MSQPRLASYSERDYCAAGAVHLLREREAKYPGLITAGKLTAAAGALGLERARAVVAQWRWAMDPAGTIDPPFDEERGVYGFGAYDFELAEELTTAASRAHVISARQGTVEAQQLADLYDALAWWQGRDAGASSCRIVRDTTCARRCAATIAACEIERKAA